jgi:hypothetical protein
LRRGRLRGTMRCETSKGTTKILRAASNSGSGCDSPRNLPRAVREIEHSALGFPGCVKARMEAVCRGQPRYTIAFNIYNVHVNSTWHPPCFENVAVRQDAIHAWAWNNVRLGDKYQLGLFSPHEVRPPDGPSFMLEPRLFQDCTKGPLHIPHCVFENPPMLHANQKISRLGTVINYSRSFTVVRTAEWFST